MPTILTSPNQDETLTNKTHNLEVLGSSPRGSAKEKELRSIRNSFFIFISLFLQADTGNTRKTVGAKHRLGAEIGTNLRRHGAPVCGYPCHRPCRALQVLAYSILIAANGTNLR